MRSRVKLFTVLAVFAIALGVTSATVLASDLINMRDASVTTEESDAPGTPQDMISPPLLVPPDDVQHDQHSAVGEIVSPDGEPVAQLGEPVLEDADTVSVAFPESGSPDESDVYFTILASVKYSVDGNKLWITTTEPSVEAADGPVVAGDQVELSDGSPAWIQTDVHVYEETPDRIVFQQDGLLVTVAGNMSADELINFASNAELH